MAKDEILYTTTSKQLEKLKSQNLIIENEERAYKRLQSYGYFNIIKGYRNPYIFKNENQITYRDGVSFEQIYSLYLLDKNLRNAVFASMLDLEEHIKAVVADVIAESFGVHQEDYIQFRNFRDKKRKSSRFSLAKIINCMKNALDTSKDPVAHYRDFHGIIPPWVLFKNLYFSTIVNLVNLLKPEEQRKVACRLYEPNTSKGNIDNLRKIMMDTLFICLEYRNLAAHGGQVYNYVCSSRLRSNRFSGDSNLLDDYQGFSQLLFLLRILNYQNPFNTLNKVLNEQVNRHCHSFPQDITYLGQILNLNIISENIVWASSNGTIYHSFPHCSGLHDPIKLNLEEAKSKGYSPCKKCCK